MLGLDTLDVAIGIVFVYLLLSLICSAAAEIVEAFLKVRARNLESSITELLRDPELVAALYNHPLINGLYKGTYGVDTKPTDLPSYIPARNFALAVMDILLTPTASAGQSLHSGAAGATSVGTTVSVDTTALSNSIDPTRKDPLLDQARHAVVTLVRAADGDAERARKNIEGWFDTAMNRASGWYKRRTQLMLFAFGLVASVVINIDTIRIVRTLATDKSKRDAIVGIAIAAQKATPALPQTSTTPPPASTTSTTSTTDTTGGAVFPAGAVATSTADLLAAQQQMRLALGTLNSLGLPIGWDNYGCQTCSEGVSHSARFTDLCWLRCWFLVLAGWLMTGLAVCLGAPFWFDTLNKIIVVRSTVKPDEKSGVEASKDPQPASS